MSSCARDRAAVPSKIKDLKTSKKAKLRSSPSAFRMGGGGHDFRVRAAKQTWPSAAEEATAKPSSTMPTKCYKFAALRKAALCVSMVFSSGT